MEEKCTVLQLSELEHISMRVDAEHYQKQFSENQRKLIAFGAIPLSELISQPILTGHTPSMKVMSYYGGDIGFIKTDNLRSFEISGQFTHHLSEMGNEVIKKSELQERDLIITIIGATHEIVGRAALIGKEDLPANINQNIALVRLKKTSSPEFLSAYLNSEVGKLALWFLSRQTGQVNLNCREVEQVLVPSASDEFVESIERIYRAAEVCRNESKETFVEVQTLLLSELGLAGWQPKRQTESVRNFSDVWGTGRIDAEYFQPKYDDIVDAIKDYGGGWDTLGNLIHLKDRNFKPDADTEYQYIELANIRGNGEISDCTIAEGEDLPSRARRKVAMGDVIVSSIEGSLESIALIDDEHDGALCSTGFHVVNSQRFNSETLLVLLKSMVGQMQLKKGCSGTILTAINKEELRKVALPIVSDETQAEIQRRVRESSRLRRQSRELLECAKRAVEIAIEDGESAAMAWLEESTADILTSDTSNSKPPFRVRPNNSGFVEGIDPVRLNQLLDDLDVEEFLAKNPK